MTTEPTFSGAITREPDVFEKMRLVAERLARIEEANAGELWTIARLRVVLATIQDAAVTYGIINDGGESVTTMMVERDALVEGLYGGGVAKPPLPRPPEDREPPGARELNFYQAEYLAKIKRVLRHAEQTRRDEFDSWRNDYEDHVRWLVAQLERRLP